MSISEVPPIPSRWQGLTPQEDDYFRSPEVRARLYELQQQGYSASEAMEIIDYEFERPGPHPNYAERALGLPGSENDPFSVEVGARRTPIEDPGLDPRLEEPLPPTIEERLMSILQGVGDSEIGQFLGRVGNNMTASYDYIGQEAYDQAQAARQERLLEELSQGLGTLENQEPEEELPVDIAPPTFIDEYEPHFTVRSPTMEDISDPGDQLGLTWWEKMNDFGFSDYLGNAQEIARLLRDSNIGGTPEEGVALPNSQRLQNLERQYLMYNYGPGPEITQNAVRFPTFVHRSSEDFTEPFYGGPLDSLWGPESRQGWEEYQRYRSALRDREENALEDFLNPIDWWIEDHILDPLLIDYQIDSEGNFWTGEREE